MKIYTSYFGNLRKLKEANIIPICIALWPPKWYKGLTCKEVAPKAYMLNDDLTREQYIDMYKRNVLSQHYPNSLIERIRRLSQNRDCALICYEKPGDFCHRHILSEWLNEAVNAGIEEFIVEDYEKGKPQHAVEQLLF